MKAHVFFYKWPGIKEGLTHREVETSLWPEAIEAPAGAYIFVNHRWWACIKKPTYNNRSQGFINVSVAPELVPTIFRTQALLLS